MRECLVFKESKHILIVKVKVSNDSTSKRMSDKIIPSKER